MSEIVTKRRLALFVLMFVLGTVLGLGTYQLVTNTVYKSRIDGVSMDPTLKDGDYALGTVMKDPASEIRRGDIISFRSPVDESTYVKRVIGLPGETVILADGEVYIDYAIYPMEEPYLEEAWTKNTGPYFFEVPEGHYLVLGDNRNESFDSRSWDVPYVPYGSVEAKTGFVIWPLHHIKYVK